MLKKGKLFSPAAITILFLGIIYVLLPSINPSGDTYLYAQQVRSGEHLFSPHHLLYNAFYYLLARLFSISDSLAFISLANAVFATGCLFFTNSILANYLENKNRLFVILLLGSCFGFMRYATTGETYILPLFFSLWASWSAMNRKPVFITALLAGIACLFHQIHIFWWLGLFIFLFIAYPEKRKNIFGQYVLGSLVVPITYLFVFYFTKHDASNLFQYIAYDYIHKDNVEFAFKVKSLLLTPINFIRTFYQVHGYILPLILKYWFVGIGVVLALAFGIIGLSKLKQSKKKKNRKFIDAQFANCHLFIFIFQLLFAAISDGNAEFMVMLPFALLIFLFIRYQFQYLPVYAFALSLFFWNMSLGLVPHHYLELTSNQSLARYIEEKPDEVYYIKDRQTIEQSLKYYYPANNFQIKQIKENPAYLDSLLQDNNYILSDILSPNHFSRSSIVQTTHETAAYNIEVIDSVNYDLGKLVISKINK